MTLTLIIPRAITAMMFLLMQDTQLVMIPYALRLFDLFECSDTIFFLPDLALWGIILADIWQHKSARHICNQQNLCQHSPLWAVSFASSIA
jgi:ABC-type sugar transport system permease subunit